MCTSSLGVLSSDPTNLFLAGAVAGSAAERYHKVFWRKRGREEEETEVAKVAEEAFLR